MQTHCTYQIELQGRVSEEKLNAVGPLSVHVTRIADDASSLMIHADQAGLIGLMRYLHGQGFVILSLDRKG
jgi:hypothetical protein